MNCPISIVEKECLMKSCESAVRAAVAERKKRITNCFVPLAYDPGESMQIDWCETAVFLKGDKPRSTSGVCRNVTVPIIFLRETLIKTKSPRSNVHTHAADFVTLRFNQLILKFISNIQI